MHRPLLLSLFTLSLAASACAPAAVDRWPDVAPLRLDSEAELDRGGATVMLPVQIYLWTAWFGGCETTDCPSGIRDGDDLVVTTDCVDDAGVAWSGRLVVEGGGDGTETHIYDGFGWENDGAAVVLDGRQTMVGVDGEAVLRSDGLEVFVAAEEAAGLPVWWPADPSALVFGEHTLVVDEQTWSVSTDVLVEPEDGEPGWLSLAGSGWSDGEDALHGSIAGRGQVFEVSGSAEAPMLSPH